MFGVQLVVGSLLRARRATSEVVTAIITPFTVLLNPFAMETLR